MIEFEFIDKKEKLKELVKTLINCDYVSIDTESNSLYAYKPVLCLLQIEAKGKIYLIDSLNINTSDLKVIFENEKIEKIFHSAYSDISMIKTSFNCEFVNIFDIMIASKYVYKKAVGLDKLVKIYFNVDMQKKYQKVNWGKRPLDFEVLKYAAMDVFYLKRLRNKLATELTRINVYDEFKAFCEKISKTSRRENRFSIERYISIAKNYNLESLERDIFLLLVEKREEIARKLNIPPFRIINNEVLIDIARRYDEIKNIDNTKIYNNAILRNIDWIKKCIKDALNCEYEKYFDGTIKSEGYEKNNNDKIKLLRKWRMNVAEKNNIPCELVLELSILKKLVSFEKISIETLKELGVDEKRIEKYGKSLVEFFNSLRKNE